MESEIQMLGIVLWHDPVGPRAVFWCEREGELAFWSGNAGNRSTFSPGDVVEFDMVREGNLLRAMSPEMVTSSAMQSGAEERAPSPEKDGARC